MDSKSSLLLESAPWTEGVNHLRERARWIRDELDPQVARDGPDALHSDDLLVLDGFLRFLITAKLSFEQLLRSRIHLAILEIMSSATRWPSRLIDRCEALESLWRGQFGSLDKLPCLLYEPGGRLHGICKPDNSSDTDIKSQWLASVPSRLNPRAAQKSGHLDFKPGDWWITPLFAFHDGIISDQDTSGTITADNAVPYAVLMTGDEEIESDCPETFTYRATSEGRGRYRLVSSPGARPQVRILRSHELRSLWAPRAGVRYDGLHYITGWSLRIEIGRSNAVVYEIRFNRCPGQIEMSEVLKRPWSDEMEDYREYKRRRQRAMEHATSGQQNSTQPTPSESGFDGADGSNAAPELLPGGLSQQALCKVANRTLFRPVHWGHV